MATPLDIAKWLIRLAKQEIEPDFLTQLRLQKLMYYVQGWSLAKRNRPAFDAPIEAWKHGPAIRQLRPEFGRFAEKPIIDYPIGESPAISLEDRFFVRCIWDAYKVYSATKLWQKTRSESPWLAARGSLPPSEPCSNEITRESMRDFFTLETTDKIDFDFIHVPEWTISSDAEFVDAAQSVLARYSGLLRRLA